VIWAKYALLILPGLSLAAASGYEEVHRHRPLLAGTILATVLLAAIGSNLGSYPSPAGKAWTETAQVVAARLQPEHDVVMMAWPADQRVFEFYYQGPQARIVGARNFDDFYVGPKHSYTTGWTTETIAEAVQGSRRLWMVREQYYSAGALAKVPYHVLDQWQIDHIELVLYEVPAP
jgi:hypothetical protein